jgi:hypothetical protein
MKRFQFILAVTLVLGACFFSVNENGKAMTIPSINYQKGGERSLIFVNNPEQLYNQDLGDSSLGDKSIFRSTLKPGKYRNFYEHVNRSGHTIGFGIQLYNPTDNTVNIKVFGSGFEASVNGGKPFVQMFQNYSSNGVNYSIAPGGSIWIVRKDSSITNGSFFSGVIDFDVSNGEVIMNNIAYRNFSSLDGSTDYMGYIQRIESDGTHEARVYKGVSPYSEVSASNVHFTIDDSNTSGVLPVQYPTFNLTTGTYGNSVVTENGWYSNIGPANNPQAVTSDMLDFAMPGWGEISSLSKSDGENKYGNLGNWGVIYTLKGTITNNGTYTRNVSINYKGNPSANAFIAYRGSDNVWRSRQVTPGSNIQYYTLSVQPNKTVSYNAKFVIGGPSAGNILQSVSINN